MIKEQMMVREYRPCRAEYSPREISLEAEVAMQQKYFLTYWDLFAVQDGELCGAEAEVAILDDGVEIDRMKFSGMCRSPEGYRRGYAGKPGLTAELAFGPGRIQFAAEDFKATSQA